MSYAGINSKDTADIITSEVVVRNCFNSASVSGAYQKAGIVGYVVNTLGKSDNEAIGGKAMVDVSCNYNTGNVSNTTANPVGGIITILRSFVHGNNCYFDAVILNNYNTGVLTLSGKSNGVGGIISRPDTAGGYADSLNVNINIAKCYNYSADISGGDSPGGIISNYQSNAARITISNSYSVFSPFMGNNPTPNGANVGEAIKTIIALIRCFKNK